MLWIENIVKNTLIPLFFINSRVDMNDFMYPHKVIARMSAFSACSSAQNGSELRK